MTWQYGHWRAGTMSIVDSVAPDYLAAAFMQVKMPVQSPANLAWELHSLWWAGVRLWWVAPAAVVLALWLATGASSIWFRTAASEPTRHARAAAVASFTCAPLLWLVVPAAMAGSALVPTGWETRHFNLHFVRSPGSTALATGAVVLLWWFTTLRVLSAATGCRKRWLAAAAFGLPITWLLCAGIGLFLFPGAAGFLSLVRDSLG